jgi:hypothetical protein
VSEVRNDKLADWFHYLDVYDADGERLEVGMLVEEDGY